MPTNPNCPLCPDNGKVDIIEETKNGYLVEARDQPVPGCFLIIPREHITHISKLPPMWQVDLTDLLDSVPWYTREADFNISLNQGKKAGQTLGHIHFWVFPRGDEQEGSVSYGKGAATLLQLARTLEPVEI